MNRLSLWQLMLLSMLLLLLLRAGPGKRLQNVGLVARAVVEVVVFAVTDVVVVVVVAVVADRW